MRSLTQVKPFRLLSFCYFGLAFFSVLTGIICSRLPALPRHCFPSAHITRPSLNELLKGPLHSRFSSNLFSALLPLCFRSAFAFSSLPLLIRVVFAFIATSPSFKRFSPSRNLLCRRCSLFALVLNTFLFSALSLSFWFAFCLGFFQLVIRGWMDGLGVMEIGNGAHFALCFVFFSSFFSPFSFFAFVVSSDQSRSDDKGMLLEVGKSKTMR